jgi:hypothetical protein
MGRFLSSGQIGDNNTILQRIWVPSDLPESEVVVEGNRGFWQMEYAQLLAYAK